MSTATLITFIIYLIGMLGIGFAAYRLTSDLSDYVLGGRRLGPGVAALSAGASDMSGWLLLGLPGAIYASGLSEAWIGVGLAIGAYLNWQFVARRLRVFTEVANDSITVPDYLENRFRDKSHVLRVISAAVILLFFTFYTSSGMVAGAKLFEASFALSYTQALWLGAIVTISYTFLGGFLAVSWTDFVQGILMFLALIAVPIVAISELGGWNNAVDAVGQIDPAHLNMVQGVGALAIISSLAWGLGYFGQPHILVRFMALRSPKDVPKARFIGVGWMVLGLYGAIFTGLVGLAYINTADVSDLSTFNAEVMSEGGVQMLADAEKIFITFSQILFHPIIAGILLAAILSAIMSTIDSQLLVSSSALAEDFYKALFRPNATERELVWVGRVAVAGIALIAVLIAGNPDSSVLDLVSYAWAGFGAAFGPIIILSLFWKGITRNGALAGIIVGAVTVVIWGDFLSGGIFDLYEIVPGFILNLIVAVAVSAAGEPPKEIIEEFDEAARR
ncbi:sodium:proline symporter [Halobacillus halophilus]|uniref:Sodium/proline symporter n=1 Tax=Halobacillus halophilus (strain ATCC 35676 / DSM 2266 / JCM 20832 / KCTC 3685 / LMG 17431 / NBRC 102448 / NCIMB 2269) TaxID=866895 RepID=I0JIL3_HALH3|nr:sodium/proline symporter PutP [Halobacillus halophilus]ASF38163.1 sodium:proline symporter [Halobacillus halophilus]CCG43981.1 sodium/proline symporter [Halobacillus halophilus DSM 2266]